MIPAMPAQVFARGFSSSSSNTCSSRPTWFSVSDRCDDERFAQLVAAGGLRHLRQRLHELLLGVVEVADFVHEGIHQRIHFGHCYLLVGAGVGAVAPRVVDRLLHDLFQKPS